jgi:hypothetical protein
VVVWFDTKPGGGAGGFEIPGGGLGQTTPGGGISVDITGWRLGDRGVDIMVLCGFSEAVEAAVSNDNVSNPGGGEGDEDAEEWLHTPGGLFSSSFDFLLEIFVDIIIDGASAIFSVASAPLDGSSLDGDGDDFLDARRIVFLASFFFSL